MHWIGWCLRVLASSYRCVHTGVFLSDVDEFIAGQSALVRVVVSAARGGFD